MKVAPVPFIKYAILTDNDNKQSNEQVFKENIKQAPNGPYVVWEKDKIPGDPVSRIVRSYYTIKDPDQHQIDIYV